VNPNDASLPDDATACDAFTHDATVTDSVTPDVSSDAPNDTPDDSPLDATSDASPTDSGLAE
jgi:hypothetical protein